MDAIGSGTPVLIPSRGTRGGSIVKVDFPADLGCSLVMIAGLEEIGAFLVFPSNIH